jgi:hypothetical protein
LFVETVENAYREVLNAPHRENIDSFRFQNIDEARAWLLQVKKKCPQESTLKKINDESDVEIKFNQKIFQGEIQDISQGGAKIAIYQAIPEDIEVLVLTSKIDTSVVWLENIIIEIINTIVSDNMCVLGFSWNELSLKSKSNLNSYLSQVF